MEYMLAVLSPKTERELPHDDWCGRRAASQCVVCNVVLAMHWLMIILSEWQGQLPGRPGRRHDCVRLI